MPDKSEHDYRKSRPGLNTPSEQADLFREGAVTVSDAVKEFGIGRTALYELMSRGELPYSQPHGRRLIPRLALRRFLADRLHAAG